MKTYAFDIECYKNYFLVQFMDIKSLEVVYFERLPVMELDEERVRNFLSVNRFVGFNSRNYDIPLLSYALTGATNLQLKELNDAIIGGMKFWDAERQFGFCCLNINHMDIMEVAPGKAGLKMYGARMHSKKLQDLPIEPDDLVTEKQMLLLREYCVNDLHLTKDLFFYLIEQLKLRVKMTREYGIDLMSKSDAQIAEAVIAKEIEKLTGKRLFRPTLDRGKTFRYNVPEFIKFHTDELNTLLEDIRNANFGVDKDGKMLLPVVLDGRLVDIKGKKYALGIGGLHSTEKTCSVFVDGKRIFDRDVTSYYPSIILNLGLCPEHIGENFLTIYRQLVEKRLAAKASKDTVTADSFKIVINGSYGKLGSVWSKLFAPQLLIETTITGQLSLLMLIERLSVKHEVYSANTDGVTVVTSDVDDYLSVIKEWERDTGFNTEETEYLAVYSRDVNNYVAVKSDYKVKTKGAYTTGGLMKNPVNTVCINAVINYLVHKGDIENYIRRCQDIREFVTVRKVEGGAIWKGDYLGKNIRWYYATGETESIHYRSNGNKVARSEGAKPIMELPDKLPDDINYEWYIAETKSLLGDINVVL